MAFSEDVPARFDAYGWHTARVDDGNDLEAIDGRDRDGDRGRPAEPDRGADPHRLRRPNKQDTQKAHGSPLGADEVRLTKEAYGWDPDRTFYVPDEAARDVPRGDPARRAAGRGVGRRAWSAYAAEPSRPRPPSSERRIDGDLRRGWDAGLTTYAVGEDFATRQASQDAIQALAEPVPELFGGAADLSESQPDRRQGRRRLQRRRARAEPSLRRPRARDGRRSPTASPTTAGSSRTRGTFLNFSDYMRGSVRLAALSGLHVIYVWTHDSVGLGEDGPTHQPVEHYAALRAIPNLWFIRPGDANETSAAWALAVERGRDGPVAPGPDPPEAADPAGTAERARDGVARGGYVLREVERRAGGDRPDPHRHGLRAAARSRRPRTPSRRRGSATRVVSLPCWELFDAPGPAYRDEVLPPRVRKRVSVEAGVVARLGALGRRRGRDRRDRPLRGVAPGGDDLRALRVHRRSAWRTSDGGSCATGSTAASRRSTTATAGGPAPGRPESGDARRRPTPGHRPGPGTEHDARRVRRRSCRCGAQGRARWRGSPPPGLGHELIDLGGDGSDPDGRLPRLRRAARPGDPGGEADRGILICGSGVGASRRGQQDARASGPPSATTRIRPTRASSTTT